MGTGAPEGTTALLAALQRPCGAVLHPRAPRPRTRPYSAPAGVVGTGGTLGHHGAAGVPIAPLGDARARRALSGTTSSPSPLQRSRGAVRPRHHGAAVAPYSAPAGVVGTVAAVAPLTRVQRRWGAVRAPGAPSGTTPRRGDPCRVFGAVGVGRRGGYRRSLTTAPLTRVQRPCGAVCARGAPLPPSTPPAALCGCVGAVWHRPPSVPVRVPAGGSPLLSCRPPQPPAVVMAPASGPARGGVVGGSLACTRSGRCGLLGASRVSAPQPQRGSHYPSLWWIAAPRRGGTAPNFLPRGLRALRPQLPLGRSVRAGAGGG